MGLLGSGRAGLSTAEAAFLNPALVGLLSSQGQLTYLDGTPSEGSHQTNMGISIVDAEPNNISNGVLSYRKLRRFGVGLPQPADGELWHGALGKILNANFAMGLSVHRLTYDVPGLSLPDQWNGSFGMLYLYSSNLGMAYVLDNPVSESEKLPEVLRQSLTHSVGVFLKPHEIARVRVDVSKQERLNPSQNVDLALSCEVRTSELFLFRFAHRWGGVDPQNQFGAGVSFIGPKVQLDYGYRQNLKDSEAMHGVDLRIPF